MRKTKHALLANICKAKSAYVFLAIPVIALMVATGSCKKNTPMASAPTTSGDSKTALISGGMTEEQIDRMVTQFYSDVTALKDEPASADNVSLQQAVLNTEAVYNKYVVVKDYSGDIATDEISFQIPAKNDGSGSVNMKEAANTFWAIKAALLTKQSNLTENNVVPVLEAFDLEVITDADGNPALTEGNYTLRADIAFARPVGNNTGVEQDNDIFTSPPTHSWRAWGSTDGTWPTNGQATIDHTNMTVIVSSIDLSKRSAPTALRALGIHNYRQTYGQTPTGYAFDISTVGGNSNSGIAFPVMPSVNCDYVTRGINDYANIRWWDTKIYDDISADPYVIYKVWLTTPMMNYYVAAIKDAINLNLAPGKYFYDFHIKTNTASGGQQSPYSFYFHVYCISSSKLIRYVPVGLQLNEL
ncbi:hypothetical protein F0919_14385 [Taibaiella lutea]|uniref:Uncharacterized protein n=1 Tax=Taibaiella lutea TaxID=2608001 RepID=A0A5M6CF92_9BACT|nr:hypothetical protein [Taibaiella lutea]KAA5533717.1 hypothetical protein F0919_14385 [Taibaiella lutea]